MKKINKFLNNNNKLNNLKIKTILYINKNKKKD